MSKELFHICLTEKPLAAPPADTGADFGARITFAGVVRGSEGGSPIAGIDYTAYVPMAESVLRRIGEDGKKRFHRHGLWLAHRIGFVPAGEASLHLMVATPHSAEGFEMARWYLGQIKTLAPIWKEIRPAHSPEFTVGERKAKSGNAESKR